ncbi:MAG: hypothetical protein Q7S46_10925 [Gallionella sp.]|nr:hypothetical protein [Gallionella sp.]
MVAPQIIPQRTVAFFDILGFRQAVLTTPLSELAAKYERRIAEADAMNHPENLVSGTPSLFPNHSPNAPWCQRFVFSDSIILVSIDDSAVSALKLLVYAWRLSQSFIAFQMPLRGGIAFGELYSNPLRNICLGHALTTAYDLEQSQAWVGAAIHSSVEEAFPEILSPDNEYHGLLDDIFLRYPVPMKPVPIIGIISRIWAALMRYPVPEQCDASKRLRTLNWRFNLVVEKGTRSLFASDGSYDVMQKVANTLKYAETVVGSGRIYVADQSNLPVELRSMWIGGKEPPFPHGDNL